VKRNSHAIPIFLSGLYFLIVHWSMGLRPEHLLLVSFVLACYYIHPKSRRFILDFLPFAYFGILYDFLRIYPKTLAGPIHVVWPHQLEMALFGFRYDGAKILPTDYFRMHPRPILDFVTGLAYSLHMVVPISFAFFAWLKKHLLARQFLQTFLIANFLAFVTYIVLPVAPPWYVEEYGLVPADWSVPVSAAGLVQFDRLVGRPYFQEIYAKNAWAFGAIPSMHAGYPFLVVLFAHQIFKKGIIPLYLFMFLVWFSAVYLRHHYVIDLIAGVLYVLAAYLIVRAVTKTRRHEKDRHPSHSAG
jgi:hypothetical protein